VKLAGVTNLKFIETAWGRAEKAVKYLCGMWPLHTWGNHKDTDAHCWNIKSECRFVAKFLELWRRANLGEPNFQGRRKFAGRVDLCPIKIGNWFWEREVVSPPNGSSNFHNFEIKVPSCLSSIVLHLAPD